MPRSMMSLRNTLFLYPVLVSLAAVFALGATWIMSEHARMNQEAAMLKTNYLEHQKILLKNEVERAVGFVRHKQSLAEIRLKESIRDRVYEAHAIAENIVRNNRSMARKNLEKYILDALRPIRFQGGRGYYFVFDMNGTEKLFPVRPAMEGRNMLEVRGGRDEAVVPDMISLIRDKKEGFYSYTWSKPGSKGFHTKIAFVKVFEPLQWVFGTGEYVDDVTHDIQEECLQWISNIRFGRDGYVFAGTYDGMSLSGPETGKNMFGVTDVNGVKIVQELIREARDGGGYVHYVVPGFKGVKQAEKLSYAMGLEDWGWYIGSGVYVDDIDREIDHRTQGLKQQIRRTVVMILFMLSALFVLVFFVTGYFSSRIRKNMTLFTRFFLDASSDSIRIDEDSLHFTEFIQLAGSANRMIEERKKAELALSTSHRRFLTVLDSIDATIYVADMDTSEILFMNKNMKDAFGGDMTGQICFKAFRNETKICSCCTNSFLVNDKGEPTGVYVWQSENPVNGKWYINYDRAIEWMDGRLVRLQIATDITSIKNMEEELLQARKMEAVGNLAGGVAHEFNNVLSIIIGNVELLLDDLNASDPLRENVKEILAASFRGRDVVRQLLNFSRKSVSEKRPVDIRLLFKEFIKLLKASIPSNIEIRHHVADDLDKVLADPTQIHQLMINLCNNGAQAMGRHGGILDIDIGNVQVDQDMASSLAGIQEGPYVRIAVADTGAGIPEDLLDRIFEPYFTTKEAGKGTGMGLAVVHGIVEDHHGAVRVNSVCGKGTVFHVFLPATMDEPLVFVEEEKQVCRGHETIVFVDDEPSIVEMAGNMLKRMGYEVLTETDPLMVLRYLKSQEAVADLVISDMTMPGLTGDLLAREIQKIRPGIPVIVCTGYSESLSSEKINDLGIQAVVMKPFQMKELGRVVRDVMDQKKRQNRGKAGGEIKEEILEK